MYMCNCYFLFPLRAHFFVLAPLSETSAGVGTIRPSGSRCRRFGRDPSLEGQAYANVVRERSVAPAPVGLIVGQGPGWYRAWMPGSDGSHDDANVESSHSLNATMIDDAERPLMGLHLTFNESMMANLTQKSLDFSDGVRVGLRPVQHWEETFNAAGMNSIAIGDSTLDCDRLRITSDPAASMINRNSRLVKHEFPWEMQAIRGVTFRTRSERGTIQATAARASYASTKDLFTIQGSPNRPAVIRQTRPDGKPGMDASVRSATIRPKTLTVENAEIIGVNIAAPPSLQERR